MTTFSQVILNYPFLELKEHRMFHNLFQIAVICLLGQLVPAVAHCAEPAKVFVVNTLGASVSLVDLKSLKEEKRIPVGKRPYGIAITADGHMLAVGVEDEEAVKFFSLPEGDLKGKVAIG